MDRERRLVLLIITLVFLGQQNLFAKEADLKYADHLFRERDYFRAVSEYKRYLFYQPDGALSARARFFVPLSYYHAGRPKEALDMFLVLRGQGMPAPWAGRTLLMASLCGLRAGMSDTPAELAGEYSAGNGELLPQARSLLFYSLLVGEKYDRAAGDAAGGDAELIELAGDGKKMRRKSERRAVFLSLLPGAGQLYAGKPGDALTTFVLNGLTIAAVIHSFHRERAATGVVFSILESGWYFGNLYTAANCARRTNRERKQKYLERVERVVEFERVVRGIEEAAERQ